MFSKWVEGLLPRRLPHLVYKNVDTIVLKKKQFTMSKHLLARFSCTLRSCYTYMKHVRKKLNYLDSFIII